MSFFKVLLDQLGWMIFEPILISWCRLSNEAMSNSPSLTWVGLDPSKQWAAVRTYLSLIKVPPHITLILLPLGMPKIVAQGHFWALVTSWPPIILLLVADSEIPHDGVGASVGLWVVGL